MLLRIVKPDDALLIDIQEEAEKQGLVLVTDGRELKYTLPNMIPEGWTRFAMKVKPRLVPAREPSR